MNPNDPQILSDEEREGPTEPGQVPPRRAWRRPGPRRRLAIAGVVALVALGSVAIWQAASNSPNSRSDPLVGRTGKPAPSFSLPSLDVSGQSISLSKFRGMPLVINFWASWCVPCRTEMPLLEQAFRNEHGKVKFLGIDSNDTSSAGRTFLDQVHVTYPVASDSSAGVATQYSLFGLPTTIFVSSSGKIVGRYIGQLHADTLRSALEEAFHA